MENNAGLSFKIYLNSDDSEETEVRRFVINEFWGDNFTYLAERIVSVFPTLSGKYFTLYWKDDDDDEVAVSTNEELFIALTEMKSNVKKFYVRCKNTTTDSSKENTGMIHPLVCCCGCNNQIEGFRYKCIVCKDFDLCSNCEHMGAHSEHPMLRISNPFMFEKCALHKVIRSLSSYVFHKLDESKRHHCRRGNCSENAADCGKKKRKCEKHESGPDTDDSEEACFRKHSHHGKIHKKSRRMCYQMLSDIFNNTFDPSQFLSNDQFMKQDSTNKPNAEATEKPSHVTYLKTIGRTISSLLDPLGIDVDVEVRAKNDNSKEEGDIEKTQKEPQPSTSKDSKKPQTSTNSGSPQKEVRFANTGEQAKETMKEEIEEITKILANQKVEESPERDGWVSFEELKCDAGAVGTTSVNGALPKTQDPSPSCPQVKEQTSTASAPAQQQLQSKLYPNLHARVPSNPVVAQALNKMLSMGFTNDGDWLTQLLEAKNGDINQALEVLSPHKQSSNK